MTRTWCAEARRQCCAEASRQRAVAQLADFAGYVRFQLGSRVEGQLHTRDVSTLDVCRGRAREQGADAPRNSSLAQKLFLRQVIVDCVALASHVHAAPAVAPRQVAMYLLECNN